MTTKDHIYTLAEKAPEDLDAIKETQALLKA